jgi:putative DNA primase/helicase
MTEKSNISDDDWNPSDYVPFQNGLYCISADELLDHTPDIPILRSLDCEYLPNATPGDAPEFCKYLNNLCGDDNLAAQCVWEFIGAVLSNLPGGMCRKAMIIYGPGGTGKSLFRNLLEKLVKFENTASLDMKQLTDRFAIGLITPNTRLCGSGEQGALSLTDVSLIKSMTGNDSIFSEKKYHEGKNVKYKGFLLYTCNELPYFSEKGNWVYQRFLLINAKNVVPLNKRDPALLDKLYKERDVIASVAMQYLRSMVERNCIFTESFEMQANRNKYMNSNDSLASFIDECCTLGSTYSTRRSDFNRAYTIYCEVNRLRPERQRDMTMRLLEQYNLEAYKDSSGIFVYPLELTAEITDLLSNSNSN